MINARKILKNVNKMTQQERIGLHSCRKPWLLDVAVDDDFSNIPSEVMFACLRMYIEQQCTNGFKPFPLWLHNLYNSAGQGIQHRIGKTIDAMTAKRVNQIDNYAVIQLLRGKPKNVAIDIESLIQDLDDIYNLDEQREMDLFENGHAVIKTSIPLEDIDAGSLATYPMQTWFWDVKVWEAAIKQGGRQEYKSVQEPGNEENISFISHLLQQCVYRLFENNLLDAKRFCSFETLVIAETERKQIWEIPGKGSVAEKEDLYHLANPEEFASVFSMDRWYAFWEKAHQHFVEIDFIKGQYCRLIITTEAARMQKRHRGREIGELGSYLNVLVQRTFDFYLVLALCQKDGEMYLAKASQENIHEVEKQLALYNSNCNFFETFLDTIPYDARRFYSMIYEMNNNSFVDVKTRIERIKQMEDYQRKNFLQKRTLIVELVALIGTILFGLPTLTETLTILRECFLPAGDLIPGNIVQLCAVGTWLLLIGLISRYLHKAYTEYEKKKL